MLMVGRRKGIVRIFSGPRWGRQAALWGARHVLPLLLPSPIVMIVYALVEKRPMWLLVVVMNLLIKAVRIAGMY